MWLLDTNTAQLHFFTSPEAVGGGYAILSHCWDSSGEQTFQEIQSIARRCAMLRLSPRRFVAKKIRRFCELAEENGYRWAWCDTCCIDKTSSADLSEAINSMFRYYSLAQVCYAYLADVSRGCTLDDATGEFYYSRWHARGWTLQELVAPRVVVFLAADWSTLATKTEIATVLQDISGVPMSVLTFEQDMADMGVARRLSWAGSRSTTRPEDEAYCLMGFFGINMPVLYGEGTRAFYRLQEEIMKTSMDPTLFIWGTYLPFEKATLLSSAVDEPPRFLDTTIGNVAPYLFAARSANMSIQCDFDGPIRAYTVSPALCTHSTHHGLTQIYGIECTAFESGPRVTRTGDRRHTRIYHNALRHPRARSCHRPSCRLQRGLVILLQQLRATGASHYSRHHGSWRCASRLPLQLGALPYHSTQRHPQ